jgi:hypothetical protein
MGANKTESNNIVKLNVGGCTYYSYKETLTKSQYFHNLLQGDMKNVSYVKEEEIFIDRCGVYFESILHYLRTGSPLTSDKFKLENLKVEAEYYQLQDLSQIIDDLLKHLKQLPVYKTMDLAELVSANAHITEGSSNDVRAKAATRESYQILKVLDTKESYNICLQHDDKYNIPDDCGHQRKYNVTQLTPKLIVKRYA